MRICKQNVSELLNTVLFFKYTYTELHNYVYPIFVGDINPEVSLVIVVNVSDSRRWTGNISTLESTLRLHVNRFIYIRTNVTFLPGCDVHF